MSFAKRSATVLATIMLWLAVARSETVSLGDPGELSLVQQIENRTFQAIELLNDTDPYEMATMITDRVEDTLKFYDDLGPLFRNGTLATYTCIEGICDIYLLPNGSMPLKKSVIKLIFDVFHTSQLKYGKLGDESVELLRTWFPARASQVKYEAFLSKLDGTFGQNVVQKIWWKYETYLLGYYGLKSLVESTWQNNIGKNLTTWDDFNEFRTDLLDVMCPNHFRGTPVYDSGTSTSEVLYILMGPHCAFEPTFTTTQLPTKRIIQDIQGPMKEIATMGNFNGGDSNRCFPYFLIRYNNYDEAVYKTFVKDISTVVYHGLTMTGFCLGVGVKSAAEREQYRSRLSERVQQIMKQILDARSVLKEDPPIVPAYAIEQVLSAALVNATSDIGSLVWKERPARYEKAIQAVVTKMRANLSATFGGNGSLEGAMLLPYAEAEKGLHCSYSTDDGNYTGTIAQVAHYFIKYTRNAPDIRSLKQEWEHIVEGKNTVLDSVFSEKGGNLCDRVLSALDKRSQRKRRDGQADTVKSTGFSAFVSVKCSYDFVWYELGWQYYTVARTTSEFVLEKNGGSFNANCGQLIFLP